MADHSIPEQPFRGIAIIKLSRGFEAIVDRDMFDELSKFPWHASVMSHTSNVYAARRERGPEPRRLIRMHRQILGFPDGEVDHINRNSLDNRMENLRVVTHGQNLRNSRMAIENGFSLCKQTGRWAARVSFDNSRIMLGRYPDRDRAKAACDLARELLESAVDGKTVAQMVKERYLR